MRSPNYPLAVDRALWLSSVDCMFMLCSSTMLAKVAEGESEFMVRTTADIIHCPNCGEAIPISQTIYHQVAERAERDWNAKALQQQRALAEREQGLKARESELEQLVQEQVKARTADLQKRMEKQAREFLP